MRWAARIRVGGVALLTRTAKFTSFLFRLNLQTLSTLSYSSTRLLLRDEVSVQMGKCAPTREQRGSYPRVKHMKGDKLCWRRFHQFFRVLALHGARAEDDVTEKHGLSEM